MEFIDKAIDTYCREHTTDENIVLKRLDRETHAKIMRPRMLSGHLQGKFLEMLCKMIKPNRVLEIGTYTGYSAICMAMGMHGDSLLHTIDINEELEDFTRKYIAEAGLESKIVFHVGNALDIIPQLDETFDLVFIDADKENYCAYYEMVMNKLNPGGFILADNVLWSGKVLTEPSANDKDTKAVKAFNDLVQQDTRVENVLLPIRDGLMLVQKVG